MYIAVLQISLLYQLPGAISNGWDHSKLAGNNCPFIINDELSVRGSVQVFYQNTNVLVGLCFFYTRLPDILPDRGIESYYSGSWWSITVPAIADTLPSQQQYASGRLSRRAKAAQKRKQPKSTKVTTITDTTLAGQLEAIRALPRDSSARIAQFTYVRKDKPSIDGSYHKELLVSFGPRLWSTKQH